MKQMPLEKSKDMTMSGQSFVLNQDKVLIALFYVCWELVPVHVHHMRLNGRKVN